MTRVIACNEPTLHSRARADPCHPCLRYSESTQTVNPNANVAAGHPIILLGFKTRRMIRSQPKTTMRTPCTKTPISRKSATACLCCAFVIVIIVGPGGGGTGCVGGGTGGPSGSIDSTGGCEGGAATATGVLDGEGVGECGVNDVGTTSLACGPQLHSATAKRSSMMYVTASLLATVKRCGD